MRLNNEELYNFFVEKEILALYHANTVGTAATYFSSGGILSRGYVEAKGLFQTPQSSDDIDKVLDVWNDIFIDTTDLHSYFNRENHYGPVLFELDRELIKDESFEIWITKNNPIYWKKETPLEQRYFQDIDELKDKWDGIQRQRKMITIRNANGPILFNYVRRIIVDDPKVSITDGYDKIHVFNQMFHRIKATIPDDHQLKGKFIMRTCGSCWCTDNYLNQRSSSEIKRLFLD
ncbi:hypothetical protein IM793_22075 [Pedobacter sp. MR2016-19]|uniref:hypothetical protein n=1 Tax=Pedobacter sp. MR2016-19 TaxID=2780089 RepID=UPI0018765D4B|nr:hypothetical protein [Pedobacter sp. MR2016-19]MBE5321859.1 hypothetical protein [Pedobacter sp. MR2016-19]